jgi:hypothetical protein
MDGESYVSRDAAMVGVCLRSLQNVDGNVRDFYCPAAGADESRRLPEGMAPAVQKFKIDGTNEAK